MPRLLIFYQKNKCGSIYSEIYFLSVLDGLFSNNQNCENNLSDNDRFQQLVIENLGELKQIANHQNVKFESLQAELYREFTSIRIELAQQKIRSGIFGMVAGTIPVAILIAITFFTGKH